MSRPTSTVLVLVPLVGTLLAASPAAADGATVREGFVCAIPVSGVPLEEGAVFTRDSRTVVTSSGRAVLVCHGSLPEGVSVPQTTVEDRGPCGIAEGISSPTSRVVVSRSGRLTLTCTAVGPTGG